MENLKENGMPVVNTTDSGKEKAARKRIHKTHQIYDGAKNITNGSDKQSNTEEDDLMKRSDFRYFYSGRKLL